MEGRSGCALEIIQGDHQSLIRKYSSRVEYNARLVKQAEKQQAFYDNDVQDEFHTPQVLQVFPGNDKELSWFEMNFVFAEKYSDYLEHASVHSIDQLCDTFIQYFSHLFAASSVKPVELQPVMQKADELEKALISNAHADMPYLKKVLHWLRTAVPSGEIPYGTCHGDFTFSNMLFAKERIYLVDFLDSFIESPIIDIVKLRQDTAFRWSVMLEKQMPQHRVNKLTQIFDHIDRRLAAFCQSDQRVNTWYEYLQVFNLLRILPYLHNQEETLFVQHCLQQIHS